MLDRFEKIKELLEEVENELYDNDLNELQPIANGKTLIQELRDLVSSCDEDNF